MERCAHSVGKAHRGETSAYVIAANPFRPDSEGVLQAEIPGERFGVLRPGGNQQVAAGPIERIDAGLLF
jgi:hypothetical protein